eukprot:1323226-Lingulodinium_polyedra.AAC.1
MQQVPVASSDVAPRAAPVAKRRARGPGEKRVSTTLEALAEWQKAKDRKKGDGGFGGRRDGRRCVVGQGSCRCVKSQVPTPQGEQEA